MFRVLKRIPLASKFPNPFPLLMNCKFSVYIPSPSHPILDSLEEGGIPKLKEVDKTYYSSVYLSPQEKNFVRDILLSLNYMNFHVNFSFDLESFVATRQIIPIDVDQRKSFDFLQLRYLIGNFLQKPLPWELNDMLDNLESTRCLKKALNHCATHTPLERNLDRTYLFQSLVDSPITGYTEALDERWPSDDCRLGFADWRCKLGFYTPNLAKKYDRVLPSTFLRAGRNSIHHCIAKNTLRLKHGQSIAHLHDECDAILNRAWPGHLAMCNNEARGFEDDLPPAWISNGDWKEYEMPSRHTYHNHVKWKHVNEELREIFYH